MSKILEPDLGTITEAEKSFLKRQKKRAGLRKNISDEKLREWRRATILKYRERYEEQ